jgi:hypothetical protein
MAKNKSNWNKPNAYLAFWQEVYAEMSRGGLVKSMHDKLCKEEADKRWSKMNQAEKDV